MSSTITLADPVREPVEWRAPPGAWARNFRLGEWLGAPVTPLFATWLLARVEDGFSASFERMFGFPARPPHHVIINGWYFTSLNFLPSTPLAMLGTLARYFVPRFVRRPRWASVAIPPLAGLGVELHAGEWREKILPAYRAAVADGEARVNSLSPPQLIELIDDLGRAAGAYFASITIVAGFAWKAELPLAEWMLKQGIAGGHLPLLVGLGAQVAPPHAVSSLDWFHPTLGELRVSGGVGDGIDGGAPRDLSAQRERAEECYLAPPLVLGETPPMLKVVVDRAAALFDRGEKQGVLRGLGASPGRVVARVRVVRGAGAFNELEAGEVLVAPATTPAWTPLFARVAAVVTDTGSILAHASLVAREYGIPAVIGTGDATSRLRDGQLVEVDGSAGTVTIRA